MLIMDNYGPVATLEEEYCYWKARCYMGVCEFEKASHLFEKARRLSPGNRTYSLWICQNAIAMEDYEFSMRFIEEALKGDIENQYFLAVRSLINAEKGKILEASDDIRNAEKINKCSWVLFCKALVLYSGRRYLEAEATLEECRTMWLQEENDSWQHTWITHPLAEISALRAKICFEKGQLDQALLHINEAITRSPCFGLWFLAKARILQETGKIHEALENLDMAEIFSSGLKGTIDLRRSIMLAMPLSSDCNKGPNAETEVRTNATTDEKLSEKGGTDQ